METKKYFFGSGEDFSEYNRLIERILDDSMSFLIFKRCRNGICIAADTLQRNTLTGKETYVHKFIFDKEKRCVFGFVGHIRRYMKNGEIGVEMLGKDLFPLVNNYDDVEILRWVQANLYNFISDESDLTDRNVQYIFYHYDAYIDMESNVVNYPNYAIYPYTRTEFGDSFAIGQTCREYNAKHRCEDNKERTLNSIKEECIEEVQKRLDDVTLPDIGGKVEWITVDKDWNVETNID